MIPPYSDSTYSNHNQKIKISKKLWSRVDKQHFQTNSKLKPLKFLKIKGNSLASSSSSQDVGLENGEVVRSRVMSGPIKSVKTPLLIARTFSTLLQFISNHLVELCSSSDLINLQFLFTQIWTPQNCIKSPNILTWLTAQYSRRYAFSHIPLNSLFMKQAGW